MRQSLWIGENHTCATRLCRKRTILPICHTKEKISCTLCNNRKTFLSFVPQQKPTPASSKINLISFLVPGRTWQFFCRVASSSPSHLRLHLSWIPPAARQSDHVPGQAKMRNKFSYAIHREFCVRCVTMLSRSSSMADMSLPNCFKLSAITCSSSVCVDPMHSKLNSFKLFASVLWHRERSGKNIQTLI